LNKGKTMPSKSTTTTRKKTIAPAKKPIKTTTVTVKAKVTAKTTGKVVPKVTGKVVPKVTGKPTPKATAKVTPKAAPAAAKEPGRRSLRTKESIIKQSGTYNPSIGVNALSPSECKKIVETLATRDKKLAKIIERVGKFTLAIDHMESPFGAIAESIVYQQLHGKAAATIYGRFKKLYDTERCPAPDLIVETPDTVLRSAGLSRSKINALKDLSAKAIAGEIPTVEETESMSDDEIVEALVRVKGVGTWTAQMFLIFRLGRLNVMPSSDYGVRKGFSITYGKKELPPPAYIDSHAAKFWQPYSTVASWYMWRATELK
jgi:3-methyladenine DNA glycosylase/8-oxoguanine DNA glycosylase